ncbi:MAG: hypothetical protein KDA92_11300 [Planctomycetales bacterium]|nr:hypothetical protein [Planctomycetales bacterium]MCA9171842.1 hypothetical protein [Planctomycetales bacterium]
MNAVPDWLSTGNWELLAQASRWPLMRLDEMSRLRVLAALSIIVLAAGFLLIFIRGCARYARWYMHREPRATKVAGDPFQKVIDSKPRLWQRESKNWQRR